MTLRTAKERFIQTLSFEFGGIVIISPIYSYVASASISGSFVLIALLSIVVMIWAAVYNTLFDYAEHKLTGNIASDRSQSGRVLHAILHEISAVALTCPLLIWLGGYSLGTALLINIGLTLTYVIYTYLFHMIYDHLRPIKCGNLT